MVAPRSASKESSRREDAAWPSTTQERRVNTLRSLIRGGNMLRRSLILGLLALGAFGLAAADNKPQSHKEDAARRNAAIKATNRLINPAVVADTDPYWQRALQEVDRSPEELQAQSRREERMGLYLPKLMRGDPHRKLLALTFDDGPHRGYTERLLALLGSERVRATFFLVGKMVEKNPALVRQIVAGGHLLGNHTFSHVTLTKIPFAEMRAEYEACNDVVENVTGQRLRFCRPPGGDYDSLVISAALEQGLTTVLWTDDPGDYAKPGTNVIEQKTLRRLSNGGIILLHDGIEQTIQVLPQIIKFAKAQGYEFVTVDQLQATLHANRSREPFGPAQRP